MHRLLSAVLSLLLTLGFSISLRANEAIWIDVRTAGEYEQGHVSDAINIPYDEITGRIGEAMADPDALIYVYCRSGRRSGIAQSALQQAGYSNVVNVGGLEDATKKAAENSVDL
jgi:phage shock protein E